MRLAVSLDGGASRHAHTRSSSSGGSSGGGSGGGGGSSSTQQQQQQMRPQCNKVFALWGIGQRVIASRAAEATLRLSRGGRQTDPTPESG